MILQPYPFRVLLRQHQTFRKPVHCSVTVKAQSTSKDPQACLAQISSEPSPGPWLWSSFKSEVGNEICTYLWHCGTLQGGRIRSLCRFKGQQMVCQSQCKLCSGGHESKSSAYDAFTKPAFDALRHGEWKGIEVRCHVQNLSCLKLMHRYLITRFPGSCYNERHVHVTWVLAILCADPLSPEIMTISIVVVMTQFGFHTQAMSLWLLQSVNYPGISDQLQDQTSKSILLITSEEDLRKVHGQSKVAVILKTLPQSKTYLSEKGSSCFVNQTVR